MSCFAHPFSPTTTPTPDSIQPTPTQPEQPIKLPPLEKNPDPSPTAGMNKMPVASWLAPAEAFMTDWQDLCLYCGSAGWDQQQKSIMVAPAAAYTTAAAAGVKLDPPPCHADRTGGMCGPSCAGLSRPRQEGVGAAAGAAPESAASGASAGRGAGSCAAGGTDAAAAAAAGSVVGGCGGGPPKPLGDRSRLFCGDCGECFHGWCTNAPWWFMDAKARAGWRCPNCKVCLLGFGVIIFYLRTSLDTMLNLGAK